MSARAIWKGHVRVSLLSFPVKIYNAIETGDEIKFNQLHKGECSGNIGYDKRCKKCSKVLEANEIVKGYPLEEGKYVVVTADDLQQIRLKSTKVIDIQGFIDTASVPPAFFEQPYNVGPDGPVATKGYGLLLEGMRKAKRVGIAKLVLRDREDTILVTPQGNGLMLYKLRHERELRGMESVPQLDTIQAPTKDELGLVKGLIDSMVTTFDQVDKTDTYHDALKELIQAKVEGRQTVQTGEEEPAGSATADIMDVLKRSIEEAKTRRKAA